MPVRKTYYPQKTFDDDFGAFVDMCATHKWEFPGVTLKMLQDAAKAQRAERSSHAALELEYRKQHESFGVAQAQRHALFFATLHAARGLFRNNKAVLAQLARFKGSTGGRRRKTTSEEPPAPAPQPPVTP